MTAPRPAWYRDVRWLQVGLASVAMLVLAVRVAFQVWPVTILLFILIMPQPSPVQTPRAQEPAGADPARG